MFRKLGKTRVPWLNVPKITISLPSGEEGKESHFECGGGHGWAPEIPFVDLTESERQLERKVNLKSALFNILLFFVLYFTVLYCTVLFALYC